MLIYHYQLMRCDQTTPLPILCCDILCCDILWQDRHGRGEELVLLKQFPEIQKIRFSITKK
jgi:hypothetical protein